MREVRNCCNLQMIYVWCKDMHAFILCKSKNMGSCIGIIMAYAWPEMESNGIEMSSVLHHWECITLGTFVICINSGSSLFIHCILYHISLLLILNQFQRITSNSNKHKFILLKVVIHPVSSHNCNTCTQSKSMVDSRTS